MKKTFTRILALTCCLFSTAAFAQLTPELLYYKWDGTGTNVPNYASAPPAGTQNATLMGGLTQGTGNGEICNGSVIGSGVSSSTDYVNTNWTTNLNGMSWTISFRTQNVTPSSTLFYIFGDATAGSFRCFTNGVAGPNNWILRGTGITDVYINGGATVAAHMCTYVYDLTTNTIYGYLDGVLVTSVAQPGPVISGTGPFKVIGYGTNVGMAAGGQMDEFRLYSRALTGAEVAQLNNPFTGSFLGSDIFFCGSDSTELNLGGWPAGITTWSTGSTADSIFVSTAGQYSIDITGVCGTGMDTVMAIDGTSFAAFTASACDMYTAPSGAQYTMSGTYMDTIPNVVGCDSILTITANITYSSAVTINPVSCTGMYTSPSGQMYMSAGTYMDTIPNTAGCDSVITINLSFGSPSNSTFAVTACGMYTTPGGDTIMTSGTYMDTIPNMSGCDSVMTINVTINQPSTSSMTVSACDMYTAPSGAMYMASGTYMDTIANMAGCDSVITIDLTINMASTSSISAAACDTYTAPSGAAYTASGTYMDTIPNMAGCDSVITIALTITNSSSSSLSATACDSYTAPSGAVYTTSGTYTDIIPNMAGCDSVITISLVVTNINAGATVSGATCTATGNLAGATFQWIDCSTMAPVAGATSGTFNATQNGSYAVIATVGSCVDTSNCVQVSVGIEENSFASAITLYPNPNSGEFNINLGATYNDVTVIITDVAGRVVFTKSENGTNMIPVSLDAPAGAYVITVIAGEQQANIRMIKE